MICSCPAKVMLAGEYAVVDGHPALLMAVNRRALACLSEVEVELSPFLYAVFQVAKEYWGHKSQAAIAANRLIVDTHAFSEDNVKLGLGSSAAATVAAMGLLAAQEKAPVDIQKIQALAAKAHANAQASMGSRGSGADVVTCTLGGFVHFQRNQGDETAPITKSWTPPNSLHFVFPWTGTPACTTNLLQAISSYRIKNAVDYTKEIKDIAQACQQLLAATDAKNAVQSIAQAGQAVRKLGKSAGTTLWLPIHDHMQKLAEALGGALKPTGAGGGDLALAAFDDPDKAQAYKKKLQKLEILCPPLTLDLQGVHLQA